MVLGVADGKVWHPRVQETVPGAMKSQQSGLYFGMCGMTTCSCQGMTETFAPSQICGKNVQEVFHESSS